jgi:hypothetical protein
MICSRVCQIRFMLESPAQSGRMRTLIHLGPIPRGYGMGISHAESGEAGNQGALTLALKSAKIK